MLYSTNPNDRLFEIHDLISDFSSEIVACTNKLEVYPDCGLSKRIIAICESSLDRLQKEKEGIQNELKITRNKIS